jgi:hypothetical protein
MPWWSSRAAAVTALLLGVKRLAPIDQPELMCLG